MSEQTTRNQDGLFRFIDKDTIQSEKIIISGQTLSFTVRSTANGQSSVFPVFRIRVRR